MTRKPETEREVDRELRRHPLRYALDRLEAAEEAAKIHLGEWVRKVRR